MTYTNLNEVISETTMDNLTYDIPAIQKLRIEAVIAKSNGVVTQSEKLLEEV